MGYEFDEDTAVLAAGEGRFEGVVTDRWNIGDRPNGGYLMALGLRALGAVLPHPDLLTVTAHFLRPPRPGPAEVHVEHVRSGRTLSTGEARLCSGQREFLRMVAASTDFDSAEEAAAGLATPPPDLPPPEACERIGGEDSPLTLGVTIAQRLEVRYPPDELGWTRGEPSAEARVRGWIRFADGRPVDPLGLIQFLDGVPPALFAVGMLDPLPTIELTAHVRARPAPGWLAFDVRDTDLVHGYVEETAMLWDSEGRAVATSRQIAKLIGWS